MLVRFGLLLLAGASIVAAGGCGDTAPPKASSGLCGRDTPSEDVTYATPDVAFARAAGTRPGEEVQSDGVGGPLPWFAKMGLYVRGDQAVVVRVRGSQQHVVQIRGWGLRAGETAGVTLVRSSERCWTAYPGGLVFSERRCARLEVEGPGDQRGSARFGLRTDC